MRFHAIQTGVVKLREGWPQGKGHGLTRNLHALLDRTWTPPLPIYAWVIEHPEGLIVVDTGETARASQPGYFPWWHPVFQLAVREMVAPEDEIGPQLQRLGFSPNDARWVVMTHLHTDHAGGLHHFPGAEILVARSEYQAALGRRGQIAGYLPQHWPSWFAPRLIDFTAQPLGPFPASHALTQAGDVQLVPTPGHSVGHLSVIVQDAGQAIVFAGDVSYTQALMQQQAIDGVSSDERLARQTLQRMLEYSQGISTIYLPSHDPEAAWRLAQRETVPLAADVRAVTS
jgi:glyoxylase-like metal-dependent hydrolase (beta-lactamase superfamily II)